MRAFSLFLKFAVLCPILLVVLMVLPAPAFAQATAATVSGTVLDASGAPVPGAKVAVSNASLGLNRELITTDGGIFVALALVPGEGYKVSVSKEGFTPYPRGQGRNHAVGVLGRERFRVPSCIFDTIDANRDLLNLTSGTPGDPRAAGATRF